MIKKVFVGPGNTAGNAKYIAEALRTVNVYAKSYSYTRHPFGYTCDFDNILIKWRGKRNILQKIFINKYSLKYINSIIRLVLFVYSINKYDVFIFISPITFLEKNKDLPILKFFNKKIAFFFPGCCERDPQDEINSQKDSICSKCTDISKQNYCLCNKRNEKRNFVQYLEKHSDIIFSFKDTAGFLINPYNVYPIYVITREVKTRNLLDKYADNTIRIIHFPSNELLKGTKYVKNIIPKLKKKYGDKIDFFSEQLPHNKVLEKLEESHILIDQFNGGYGLLGVEGFARGCVVIECISKWFEEDLPDLPCININPENIEEKLIWLIENPDQMKKIAQKGIEYYKKYHTPEAVGNYYKKILKLN